MSELLPKILLLETIEDSAMTLLQSATRTVLAAAPDQGLSQSDLDSFTGLITRGKGKVDRPLLEAMPRLQVIVRPGVGLDNVDVMAAT